METWDTASKKESEYDMEEPSVSAKAGHFAAGTTKQEQSITNSVVLVDRFKWIAVAVMSACLYAAVTLLVSSLANEIDALMVTFTRVSLSSVLAIIVACYSGTNLSISNKTELRMHAIQSVITVVTLSFQFYAFQHMPASDANTIVYGQVILVGVFGRLIYKEPFKLFEITMVAIACLGIMLIARPSFLFKYFESEISSISTGIDVVPLLAAIVASVFGALMVVHARAMGLVGINVMALMFYSMIFSTVILAVPLTILEQWTNLACIGARLRLCASSVAAFTALSLFNYAVSLVNGVYVALVLLLNVPIVFVVAIFIFNFNPNWASVAGTVLIFSSCIFVSLRKIKTYQETVTVRPSTDHDCERSGNSGTAL